MLEKSKQQVNTSGLSQRKQHFRLGRIQGLRHINMEPQLYLQHYMVPRHLQDSHGGPCTTGPGEAMHPRALTLNNLVWLAKNIWEWSLITTWEAHPPRKSEEK